MDELHEIEVELDSPEATHIGPIGTALPNIALQALRSHCEARLKSKNPGAQRLANEKIDAMFLSFGGQAVVKSGLDQALQPNAKTRKALSNAGPQLVEMRRFELLTPYMRSKCSTS